MELRVVDLFAGIGGMSEGFKQAGAKVVWANEFNKYACKIYSCNMHETKLIIDDIHNINSECIPDFDILVSSFPFQAFSNIYDISGDDYGSRNLFYEILRVIVDKKPRAFLLENVKGLISHNNGKTIEIIQNALNQNGYLIKYKVLNSKEYGNVPQNRERIYLVGFQDIDALNRFSFPEPISLTKKIDNVIDIYDKKDDKYYITEKSKHYHVLVENVIKKDNFYYLRRGNIKRYKICPPVIGKLSKFTGPLVKDNYGIRILTPKECLFLQGHLKYNFPDNISDFQLYLGIGNSSTVTVIKRIAERIINAIDVSANNGFDELENEAIIIKEKAIYHEDREKSNYMNDISEITASQRLINELNHIKPGNEESKEFHEYIYRILKMIFEEFLSRPQIEREINEGSKRIDILFDNLKEQNFFYELRTIHKIHCPKIIIECKNYNSKISNPEIDQLLGRFNKRIGKFGIIICRKIEDRNKILKKCKDSLNGGQGHILVFCDEDIKQLINLHFHNDKEDINDYLRDRLDELIL